ncbi:hypothetical protein [Dongia mobilis]|uniref:hypothetical protein n=1 Tax=Dongia sp. TaxID=1977262 RepID=UPI0026EA8B43
MKSSDYASERTSAGVQYVIPGAERLITRKLKRSPLAREGEQFVLPGAEPISTRELLARLSGQPLRPRRGQRSLNGTALFGAGKR